MTDNEFRDRVVTILLHMAVGSHNRLMCVLIEQLAAEHQKDKRSIEEHKHG